MTKICKHCGEPIEIVPVISGEDILIGDWTHCGTGVTGCEPRTRFGNIAEPMEE